MKRPAFITLLFLISGRICGTFLNLPGWLTFSALVLVTALAFYYYKKTDVQGRFKSARFLFAAVLLMGLTQQRWIEEQDASVSSTVSSLSSRGEVILKGTMNAEPEARNSYFRFILDNTKVIDADQVINLKSPVIVYAYSDAARKIRMTSLARGDVVTIRSEIQKPVSSRNPTLFNYRAFLANKGIYMLVRINQGKDIKIQKPIGGRSFYARIMLEIHHLKQYTEDMLESGLTEKNAALLKGVILGKSHEVSESDRSIFMETGLMHLFAVSGLHTGLIALLLLITFRLAYLNFRLTAILTMAGIWLFAMYTGFRSPVVRAAIMVSCLLASYWLPGLQRKTDPLSVFTFAAFFVLIFNPRALMQADFQFSYVSVFFIILLRPFCKEYLSLHPENWNPEKRKYSLFINRYILMPVQIVFSAQLGLIPLLAFYYHRFSLVSLLANPVALPLAFFALAAGIIQVIIGTVIPGLLHIWTSITGGVLNLLRLIITLLANVPFSSVYLPAFPFFITGAWYALILSGRWVLEKKEYRPGVRISFLLICLTLAVIIVWLPIILRPGYDLQVFFLDVGQGDSIYVEFDDGSNMLIDGGRNRPYNMGAKVITPFLRNRGVDKIDVIIATHPDSDHIGGLSHVMDHFFIGKILRPDAVSSSHTFAEFTESIKSWDLEETVAARGDTINGLSDSEIIVLSPPDNIPPGWYNNDRSIVLKMEVDSVSFLFTGDAEKKAEMNMIQSGMPLRAEVLKAGHHGSLNSTSAPFLNLVSPDAAVISAGARNRFGHPHDDVIERLEKKGVRIFRTDEDGAVIFRLQSRKLSVETMN